MDGVLRVGSSTADEIADGWIPCCVSDSGAGRLERDDDRWVSNHRMRFSGEASPVSECKVSMDSAPWLRGGSVGTS